MSDQLEYGNARVRAMKSRLLGRADYERLLAESAGDLPAALLQTPYREDVEASLPRFRGVRCVHEALRQNLGRTLRRLRGFYDGAARRGIDLLLGRYNLSNLRTILRGQLQHASADAIVALLAPAGTLDDTALGELAREPDVRACIDRMVAWRLPSAKIAWALARAQASAAALERTLQRIFAEERERTLRDEPAAPEVERVLTDEMDQGNVLVALRVWEAYERGEVDRRPALRAEWLPGGRLRAQTLEESVAQPSRATLSAYLGGKGIDVAWADALGVWAAGGSVRAAEDTLERVRMSAAIRGFIEGDPLSLAIPVAYVFAKEREVRNLRLVAAAGVLGAPAVREQLLL